MVQNSLLPSRVRRQRGVDQVGVVELDRKEDQEIVLRFMAQGESWGQPAREVRLDLELAEQLRRFLSDELEDVAYMAG